MRSEAPGTLSNTTAVCVTRKAGQRAASRACVAQMLRGESRSVGAGGRALCAAVCVFVVVVCAVVVCVFTF